MVSCSPSIGYHVSMKILIVSPKFHPIIGGGETFVLNSAQQLHAAGHEVALAVEPHPFRIKTDYPFPVFEIPGLSDARLDVLKAPNGLYKLLESYKPDVIHVHGYFSLLAVGLCNQNIPVIASIHSTPVWGQRIIGGMDGFDQELVFAEQILRFTMPRIVTGANNVYTDVAQKLVPKTVMVNQFPYPILEEFYEMHERSTYRTMFGLNDSDVLVTVPSRIIERKGIREAVVAISTLPDNFYLCLPAATNPLDMAYWHSIQESDSYIRTKDRMIIPKVEILHDQMPSLYAASDLVIMPSYYEGAPVATVEAMASHRPFIGADSQGINGFIKNMENGILVPPKSSIELADAILTLSNNFDLQQKFTTQAARDVAHLSWEIQLPKLIDLYQRCVE